MKLSWGETDFDETGFGEGVFGETTGHAMLHSINRKSVVLPDSYIFLFYFCFCRKPVNFVVLKLFEAVN